MEQLKALKILLGAYINDEGDVAFECKSLNEINTAVAELSIITSELEALQVKPPCCQFNDINMDNCDGCDWVDECIYHKYHKPKDHK